MTCLLFVFSAVAIIKGLGVRETPLFVFGTTLADVWAKLFVIAHGVVGLAIAVMWLKQKELGFWLGLVCLGVSLVGALLNLIRIDEEIYLNASGWALQPPDYELFHKVLLFGVARPIVFASLLIYYWHKLRSNGSHNKSIE